ncbi:enoyl-CoA hydratase/isomerase family protein [Fodinicola feengrottensis]|uniref:enoyl-CoA hydratase/isomerase family protein n=1 Tax=Fodinicola feengrottensis TaxID=435914 RepID=UPI00244153C2|nr:enoyl-CoA hydratase-related protein [Fodinicola feengrottensis]
MGLSVTGGATRLLALLVGPLKAKELLLLGEPVTAAQAVGLGLVNRTVPAHELLDAALAWAGKLAMLPRLSLALAKKALDAGIDSTVEAALEQEISDALESQRHG